MKSLLVFFALVFAINAQTQVPGLCPSHVVQSNFNLTAYVGKWFENKRYAASFQEKGDCVTAQYTINPDNATVNVVNSMVILPSTKILDINGTARLQSTTPPIDGRLWVKFLGNESDYWVLNTDYQNYAVVWSCTNNGNNSIQYAWILSRERQLTADVERKLTALLPTFRLNETLFRKTEQSEKICKESSASIVGIVSPITLILIAILLRYATKR